MSSETQKIVEEVVRRYREGQKAAAAQETASNGYSGNEAQELSAAEDPYAEAPGFYPPEFAGIFRNLPFEFRKFLHEREADVTHAFKELGQEIEDCRWMKEVYGDRQERLRRNFGFLSPQQYFAYMAALDDALEASPEETLRQLAGHYGVAGRLFAAAPVENKAQLGEYVRQVSGIAGKLTELERRFQKVNEDFAAARQRDAERLFKEFMEARDEKGRAKHEFFASVKPVVYRLLLTGAAADLEEAYEMAVWANADIRARLIADNTDASIKSKAEEAVKAKEASFSPKGHQKSKPDYSKMTTREIVESIVAQYRNNQL